MFSWLVSASGYVNVDVSQAKQMIESDPNLAILDVRTQQEYNTGHIHNAILIPVTELPNRLGELNKERETLVYCGSGGRSATASQILVDNGFSNIYNMLGGITAWRNAGYPIEGVPPPTYNVDISAHCNTESVDVSLPIMMDGSLSGHSTAYTFSGLSGTHTFEVPSTDNAGHSFLQWSTGQTSTTITVSSAGMYTAYYQTVNYTVNLDSCQDTHTTTHLGNITLDGIAYSLPGWVSEVSGIYSIGYNATSGYEFDHWEATGGLSITNQSVQSTSVTVSGNGNLTAVYKESIINTIYLMSRQNNGTAINIGTIQFDGQLCSLPDNLTKASGQYLLSYTTASGFKFACWEASSNITLANAASQDTSMMVSGSGNICAVVTFLADLDKNGKVDIFDVTIIARAYGSKIGDPKWNAIADLNEDGVINILDVTIVARDYGKTL
jgi:rhodanese-related sulfurtransferase